MNTLAIVVLVAIPLIVALIYLPVILVMRSNRRTNLEERLRRAEIGQQLCPNSYYAEEIRRLKKELNLP